MKPTANKINKEWHQSHKMPANAKLDQRIEWHIEHSKNCTCRPMPDKIRQEIERRKGQAIRRNSNIINPVAIIRIL